MVQRELVKMEKEMLRGIDCASPVSARAAMILKAEGFSFVGRYLVPPSYAKALSWAEAEILHAAGLEILLVWETTAARMRGGTAAGREDGARACARAQELGVPETAILYFAADFDACPEEMSALRAYLTAARDQTGPYEVGVYGSYRVVEAMRGSVARGYWQCVAWSGGRVSDAMTVYQAQWQGAEEARALGAKLGFAVDIDECPDTARAGMWPPRQPEPVAEKEDGMDGMERYNSVAELPTWAKPTIRKLIGRGCLKGNGGKRDADGLPADLDLSEDMIRILVINDRAGVYE